MSAEIINLRQARKQRARDEKAARGAENRARFGRTKAEREREEQSQARADETLDGHRLEPRISEPPPSADDGQKPEPAPKTPR